MIILSIKANDYFIDGFKYVGTVTFAAVICRIIKNAIMYNLTIFNFILMIVVVTLVPNILFLLFFRKTEEFLYMKNIILSRLKRR